MPDNRSTPFHLRAVGTSCSQLAALVVWLLASTLSHAAPAPSVQAQWYETLGQRAQQLAEQPYTPPADDLPESLSNINYDTYRQIRFNPQQAYWKDDGHFSLQTFHSGFLFTDPVELHIIEDGRSTPLPFQQDDFIYEGAASQLESADLSGIGHAGFRLHYPLNTPDYADEFAVFLGASYFRLIGQDQIYGLSTRGIAIDTAAPQGEEFPAFRAFWLFKPEADDHSIHIMALLDGPSLTGVYHFELTPGQDTHMVVDATLFARDDIGKLGIAPLTSMFTYGDISASRPDDFRPNVHDSQGLLLHTGQQEWIWRPLTNPAGVQVSAFLDRDPKGFGLMQRERDFAHYLDLEAQYHRRPSQWVEPLDAWGPGHVELVEIPTPDETHDNVVAYWVADTPLEAGQSKRFRYHTQTLNQAPQAHELAKVIRSRQGNAAIPGEEDSASAGQRQWIVDFAGGELATPGTAAPVELRIDTSADAVTLAHIKALPNQQWRATFRVDTITQPLDVRLALTREGQVISETWNQTIPVSLPTRGPDA
ncbi:glucan biosynthesis protein [Halomonas sp. LS-001]